MQGRCLDPDSPLPRYYQIYSALLAMIDSGELKVGEALPPERQIAECFGVARPTVVRALELLERDGLLDKQQGRGSFVLERPLRDAPAWTLAFISSPSITYDLMLGISQTAFERGCQLQLFSVDFKFKNLAAYMNTCLETGVDGFLVYGRPGRADLPTYRTVMARGVPLVMVDRYYPDLSCDHVVYDNEAAGAEVTAKLLARGHERVAIIPGFELEATSVQDRLSGYRRALSEHGVPYDEDLVWLDLYDQRSPSGVVDGSYRAQLGRYLETHRPSALVTINDNIADCLIHDLLILQRSLLYAPPGEEGGALFDLEIATFGDRLRADSSYLTVVAVHPTARLGRAAAELLIGRLDGSVTGAPYHHAIPMDIAELPRQVRQIA